MGKPILRGLGALLFLFWSIAGYAALPENQAQQTQELYSRLTESLSELQDQDHWHGAVDADPSSDALVLLVGKKLGLLTPELQKEILDRIFAWKAESKTVGWPSYPKGPPSADATGVILYALQSVGIGPEDSRTQKAWEWFKAQGEADSINMASRSILAMTGAIPPEGLLLFSPSFFSLPKQAPINVHNIGIGRTAIVPLSVWAHYRTVCELGLTCSPLDAKRVRSGGEAFGKPWAGLPGLKDGLNALRVLIQAARNRIKPGTRMEAAGRFFPQSPEFWAQEGLGWLLRRQQKDGSWAGLLQLTVVSMLSLEQAQAAGVADFSREIRASWEGLLGWRRENDQGARQQQITQGPIMDTARVLTAFLASDESIRGLSKDQLRQAARWLVNRQILNTGDWAAQAPHLKPGGWAFQYHNDFYPDIDDTAMVIEALAKSDIAREMPEVGVAIRRGLNWVLGLQNSDGGFPVWDRDTSIIFNKATTILSSKPISIKVPRIADSSQVDVTSRVLRMLLALKEHPVPGAHASAEVMRQTAKFLLSKRVSIPGDPLSVWEGDWMTNYLYGTSEVLDSLISANEMTLAEAKPYMHWLASKQDANGGWGESNETYAESRYIKGPPTLSQTLMVMNALITYQKHSEKLRMADPVVNKAISLGLKFVTTRIGSERFPTEAEYTGIYAKDLWYGRYALAPHYEAVRVLGRILSGNSSCSTLLAKRDDNR